MIVLERTSVEKMKTRQGFGKALAELGRENPNIVAVTSDVGGSVNAGYLAKEYPERLINCGVAEQNACNVAAGLSLVGKIPFFALFGCFATTRCIDMIRTTICYGKLNVKIAGTHGGIITGEDGASHQALEEIGLMRILPNMTVIVPCDFWEAKRATKAVAAMHGPCYLRLGRASIPLVTDEYSDFEIGKGIVLREGNDVAIVACGVMVYEALLAAEALANKGVEARVINLHTIKPIDKQLLVDAAVNCGAIVTAEEHQVHCGMGSAVAEVLAQHQPVPMEMVGIQDRFGESGLGMELLTKYGLRDVNIIEAVDKVLRRKK